MTSEGSARDDRLLDLARRLLSGEAIDWAKEGVEESEVREGMERLQRVIGTPDDTATAEAPRPAARDGFIGPFRIVRKLGEGGMGVVYEAEQQRPKRPVALKVIRGGRHVDAHTLRLFQREIQTLARLNHPGIAQLYETGVTDDGMHYFAMELIRGMPLADWLDKRGDGPISPGEMKVRLGVFRKICDAVAYAHQRGVIHRDLKPGNILIPSPRAGASIEDAVPEVKILDFGLARITDTDVQMTTYVTEMGRVQGTLPYMSPEQVRGNPDEIDLRTDVYSLGVILYEMVTGHLPFDLSKVQLADAVRIICEDTPRSLSATSTGTRRLDPDVATITGKCLEKKGAWGRFYEVNSLAYSGFANSAGPFSVRVYEWAGAEAEDDFREHIGDGSAHDIHNPANWAFSFEQSTLIPFDYTGVDRPQGADRWLLEYDHLLPHDLAVKLRYVDHESRDLIEDINSLDTETFFRFVVQNTGLKRRDYSSWELEFTGRPRPNLSFGASYVHSKSEGTNVGQFEAAGFQSLFGSTNYIGVYLDRPPSDPSFWCTLFGPTCLPPDWVPSDPRLDFNNDDRVDEVDFDLSIQNLFAGLGSTQTDDGWYGPLTYAVDDLVKAYGRLDVPRWGNMYFAWYLQWGSGYHMSRRSFVDAYGDFLGFADTPHYEFVGDCMSFDDCDAVLVTAPEEDGASRGSVDMPSFWSLDLTVGKLWQTKGRLGIEVRADLLNVFDNQEVLTIQDRSTDTYGEPLGRQPPRAIRL